MTEWTVLVAFMDEEVSPVLRELLGRRRPVLVVERGAISQVPPRIFEQPVESFPVRPTVVASNGLPQGYRPPRPGRARTLPERQQALAWQLRTLLEQPQAAGGDLPSDFVRKLNERAFFAVTDGNAVIGRREKLIRPDRGQPPALSVLAFEPANSQGTPVVLVRAPEMGMQPSLMRPYLRLIAKALTILLAEKDQVCLRAYGASGAIGGTSPGDITAMAGSLFVGAERDLLGGVDTVRSIVALATADSLTYLHDKKVQPTSAADLKRAWEEAENQAKAYLTAPGPELKQQIDALRSSSGRQVSLTLSFFGGQEVKRAASALGLFSTNTEDYHLFRLARSMKWPKLGHWDYPRLADVTVQRVDVDPPDIPEAVVGAYGRWTARARLTAGDYRDLLGWGLAGCPLTVVPRVAWWRFAEDPVFQDPSALSCFGRYAISGDIRPLDPVAVEIAVDMLRDLSDDTKASFGTDVKAAASRVLTADPEGQAEALDAFIAVWGRVKEVQEGRVWVRLQKWAGNDKCWLDTIEASASNVDRSFYRSANLLALAEAATTFVGPLAKTAV